MACVAKRTHRLGAMALGAALVLLAAPWGVAQRTEPTERDGVDPIEPASSSFHRLASWVAGLPLREPNVVVVAPVQASSGHVTGDIKQRLHTELVALVGGAVPLSQVRHELPLGAAEARSLARRKNLPLVYLSPHMDQNGLRVDAYVLRFPRSFWQKARKPLGTLAFQQTHTVPLDSMVRRYFPPSIREPRVVSKLPMPVSMPLALACGGLTENQARQLLLVGRTAVSWGQAQSGAFRAISHKNWADLSDIAAVPLREPLGSAVIEEQRLWFGSSDRADTLSTDRTFQVTAKLPRGFPLAGGKCAGYSSRGLTPPRDCTQLGRTTDSPGAAQWDALSAVQFIDPSGVTIDLFAGVELGTKEAVVIISAPTRGIQKYQISDVAGPLAWGDLNGDGRAELITTSATSDSEDAVIIFDFNEGGHHEVGRIATPPVRALAICPFALENPTPVFLGLDNALWEIRP